ncbi:hypothetical protein EYZ11_003856 [Aspergillus tanneri]|uniref:HTH psq-type domain-containing protein n=1 Tax=Aspergillus tanneri TaxID=1220188 RepID=A0A4S3JSU2_9EURO|nr:hypothetical protein EYZ11_003856 [Aspergillus tanneri]
MPKDSDKIKSRIPDALRAYHERNNPKIAALAREFDIPYQRLWNAFIVTYNFIKRLPRSEA